MSENNEGHSRCLDKHRQYHYSPKALREWRDIADALEERELKPTNLHGTRWLPHLQKALTVLLKNYTVIITHFDHITGGRIGKEKRQIESNQSAPCHVYMFTVLFFASCSVSPVMELTIILLDVTSCQCHDDESPMLSV